MKALSFSILLACCFLSSKAAIKTVVANTGTGWTTASNWSPAGVPATGDVVVIPTGQVITLKGNVYSIPAFLLLQISGTLDFEPSGKLDLTPLSTIQIFSGGAITSDNNNSEVIWINGITKYQGGKDPSPLLGPLFASNASGVSPTGFIPGIVLPLSLTHFSAAWSNNTVLLQWKVEDASAHDVFTVEKSRDAREWTPVQRMQYREGQTHYSVQDKSKATVVVYYRLKMTHSNGSIAYSQPAMMKQSGALQFSVAPNPAASVVYLTLPEASNHPWQMRLLDASGRVVHEKSEPAYKEESRWDLSTVKKGYYTLQLLQGGLMIAGKQIILQ